MQHAVIAATYLEKLFNLINEVDPGHRVKYWKINNPEFAGPIDAPAIKLPKRTDGERLENMINIVQSMAEEET